MVLGRPYYLLYYDTTMVCCCNLNVGGLSLWDSTEYRQQRHTIADGERAGGRREGTRTMIGRSGVVVCVTRGGR